MSTFGDNTAKQEILDALEGTIAKQAVHPLVFLQLVLEVVAHIASDFAWDQGEWDGWDGTIMVRTEVDGEYVDAKPYTEGKEV